MALVTLVAGQRIKASELNANFALCVLTDTARTVAVTHTWSLTQTFTGGWTAGAACTISTGGLTVTAGGLTVTAGGLTVTAGGLTVSAGTSTLQAVTATTVSATSTITATGADIAHVSNGNTGTSARFMFQLNSVQTAGWVSDSSNVVKLYNSASATVASFTNGVFATTGNITVTASNAAVTANGDTGTSARFMFQLNSSQTAGWVSDAANTVKLFNAASATIATFNAGALTLAGALSGVTTLAMGGALSGVTTVTATGQLKTTVTTQQLALHYDADNHLAVTVSSAGAVTYNATGASAGHTFSDPVTFSSYTNGTNAYWASAATALPGGGGDYIGTGGTTQTTVGAAGAASALPANPTGYWIINVSGTNRVVPFYAVS